MGFIQDFKDFALKGNVFDLAIGVIIGGAFGKIVSSLVNDIIMPPFGFALQGIDFKNLRWVLKAAPDGAPIVSIAYGSFLQNLVEFVIIALVIFLMIQAICRIEKRLEKRFANQKAEEAKTATPTQTSSEEVQLLREIRDSLKNKPKA